MMRAMRGALIVCAVVFAGVSAGAPVRAIAQDAARGAVVAGAVARARALIDKGEGGAARALLDSLVRAQDADSDDLAESLYWRAVLAESATDAERDWLRLVIETTLSPRVPDALLWLGELELVRGHAPEARAYFQRLLRDFADAPQRGRASLWIARSHVDAGNRATGCPQVASLRATLAEGELRLQAEELHARCVAFDAAAAEAATVATAEPEKTPEKAEPAPAAARFTVQLAAFSTRREAESAVRRLGKVGVTARIDGARKPFRVRTGRYATRAEATKAVAALKKRGQKGIVAEIAR